ncbi:Phytanoyl-CoA dioxygenase family protein [Balamuthia mandrillaris]
MHRATQMGRGGLLKAFRPTWTKNPCLPSFFSNPSSSSSSSFSLCSHFYATTSKEHNGGGGGMLSKEQRERFRREGFLVLPELLDRRLALRLQAKVEPLFAGEFDTGVYPDEWHWRKGMSRDDVTREIVNAWKSDTTIASVVLSERLGRIISQLMGWQGTRIAQDDVWWKPPGTAAVAFHQDSPYFDFLEPANEVVTCWIALDDTTEEAGTLQYARGSHLWKPTTTNNNNADDESGIMKDFFTSVDYQRALRKAAAASGAQPDIVSVEVPIGGCAFHDGRLWHGSGKNVSKDRIRRSLAVHAIRHDCRFKPDNVGYIYGRYKMHGKTEMEETFFPITWREDGYRSPSIAHYAADPLA